MLTTSLFGGLILGLIIAYVILWAACLRLGLRWAGIEGATTGRIVFTTAIVALLQTARDALNLFLTVSSDAQRIAWGVAGLAAIVGGSWLVIALVFKGPVWRSLQAWLPTLLPSVATVLFMFLVMRPFFCEAYVSPTNAMAPTLLGKHWQGVCPQCGAPNFCSPPRDRFSPPDTQPMICEKFHVSQGAIADQAILPADHFLVAKFLSPRRWDIVVFKYPAVPSMNYVERLVGLPGETIRIADGAVWANGKKLTPPDSLGGIEYLSQMPMNDDELWGTENRPATLGADEYFVLGDFSARSADSRCWREGAARHNPYAVPASYLQGVVTHIYWPPERCRILR